MTLSIGGFNKDQFDGLAKLSFDLAKASFLLALFPASSLTDNLLATLIKGAVAAVTGLAFIYAALLLLGRKEMVLE